MAPRERSLQRGRQVTMRPEWQADIDAGRCALGPAAEVADAGMA